MATGNFGLDGTDGFVSGFETQGVIPVNGYVVVKIFAKGVFAFDRFPAWKDSIKGINPTKSVAGNLIFFDRWAGVVEGVLAVDFGVTVVKGFDAKPVVGVVADDISADHGGRTNDVEAFGLVLLDFVFVDFGEWLKIDLFY